MACCTCCHLNASQMRMWSVLWLLVGAGLFACHFYKQIPTNKVMPFLGEKMTADEEKYTWYVIGAVACIDLLMALAPTNVLCVRLSAVIQCLKVLPVVYLTERAVMAKGFPKTLDQVKGFQAYIIVLIVAFTRMAVAYNYWEDNLAGFRAFSKSASRSASSASSSGFLRDSVGAPIDTPSRASAATNKKKPAAASKRAASSSSKKGGSTKRAASKKKK